MRKEGENGRRSRCISDKIDENRRDNSDSDYYRRTIILDIGLLEPERLHEQYIQEIKQIDGDIFGEDSLPLRYEYEVEKRVLTRSIRLVLTVVFLSVMMIGYISRCM